MSSKIFRAIILGAPASGKGTISNRILKNFQFNYMAMGDILRQNIEANTKLGSKAKRFISKGELVPDHLVIKCILKKINHMGANQSWLLDGFPRTRPQAIKLLETQKIDTVLNLIVPHEVIIDRVKSRWIHLSSGRVYNIGFNEPKVPFHDDITGEPLQQRPDDSPTVVRKRLEIYDNSTKPVIEYFTQKGILENFQGNTSDEIWPNVKEFLTKQLTQ